LPSWDVSAEPQVAADYIGDVGSQKDQAVVVLAVDQQRPAVAVAPEHRANQQMIEFLKK
jgi:hypothetical protein